MKKLFIPFILILMTVFVFGCGKTETTLAPTNTVTGSSYAEEKTVADESTASEKVETETVTQKEEASQNKEKPESTTKKSSSSEIRKEETKKNYCTIEISCKTILSNLNILEKGKESFVPKNGIILKKTKTEFKNGETVFDVLKRVCNDNVCTDSCRFCKKNGIQLEFSYTPGYDSYYIEGIHQLYEKDCSTESGWMYSVNGKYPNKACSEFRVHEGDIISFNYTCNLGDDLNAEQQQ